MNKIYAGLLAVMIAVAAPCVSSAQDSLFAPTGLTVKSASSSHFLLSWKDNSSGEAGFLIERKGGTRGFWTLVGRMPSNSSSFEAGGCSANTNYAFRIRSFIGTSYSDYSETADGKTGQHFDKQTSRVIESSTARQGEGTFLKTTDNALHLFFGSFTGTGDKDISRIARKTSADGGKTWGQMEILFKEDGYSLLHPSAARVSTGRIGIAYSKMVANSWRAFKVFRYSDDEGKTWSPEIKVSDDRYDYTTGAHDRFVKLSNGILVNVVHSVVKMKSEDKKGKLLGTDLFGTKDGGLSWYRLNDQTIINTDNDFGTGEYGFYEASLVEYEPGKLGLYGRNATRFLLAAWSADFGKTWTQPEPVSIQHPLAPVRIELIPGTKKLLLVHNPNVGSRQSLAARISEDGGRTWTNYVQLEYDDEYTYSYPAIYIDGDTVHLAYWKTTLANKKWKKVEIAYRALPLSFFEQPEKL